MAAASEPQVTFQSESGVKWASDPEDAFRVHLQIVLSPEMNQIMERLRERYQMKSKADVINLAVGLLNRCARAAEEGKHVGIVGSDQELEVEFTSL
jgi:hypothetical protein